MDYANRYLFFSRLAGRPSFSCLDAQATRLETARYSSSAGCHRKRGQSMDTPGSHRRRRVAAPGSSSGGPSKLRSYQQLALLEMLSMGAEVFGFRGAVWTGPRVVALVRHFLGISYHPGHMSRLLRRWGWSVQKPVRQAQQRDEAVIAQWPKQTWSQLKKSCNRRAYPRLYRRSRLLPITRGRPHLVAYRHSPGPQRSLLPRSLVRHQCHYPRR